MNIHMRMVGFPWCFAADLRFIVENINNQACTLWGISAWYKFFQRMSVKKLLQFLAVLNHQSVTGNVFKFVNNHYNKTSSNLLSGRISLPFFIQGVFFQQAIVCICQE